MVDFSVKLSDPVGTKDLRKSRESWWVERKRRNRDGRQGRE
jgi:hypothetical protein